VEEMLKGNYGNGYAASFGTLPAREAIATYSSREGSLVTANDIVVGSGCSGALELVVAVLINDGDNILIPRPGFSLYEVLISSLGGVSKSYPLLPEKDWECDIIAMEAAIDSKTRAILINNPSNPCGSNYSKEHLQQIVDVAKRHNLLIVADEIYGALVFDGDFTPIQSVRGDVPVLSVGGIAKEFVVPGWRVGWVVIHDHTNQLNEIRVGLRNLSTTTLGANTLIQGALPKVLTPSAGSEDSLALSTFHTFYLNLLRENSLLCENVLADCPQVQMIRPKGAMYAMMQVNFDKLDGTMLDDTTFSQVLLREENLIVLPGQCFCMPNYVRLVVCCPSDVLTVALNRIKAFCVRHAKSE